MLQGNFVVILAHLLFSVWGIKQHNHGPTGIQEYRKAK